MKWLNTSGKPRALVSFFLRASIVKNDSLVCLGLEHAHYRLPLYSRYLERSCHCGSLCFLSDADVMIRDIVRELFAKIRIQLLANLSLRESIDSHLVKAVGTEAMKIVPQDNRCNL